MKNLKKLCISKLSTRIFILNRPPAWCDWLKFHSSDRAKMIEGKWLVFPMLVLVGVKNGKLVPTCLVQDYLWVVVVLDWLKFHNSNVAKMALVLE